MAIHDSELTRALATMAATADTPTGPGTTNKQWWTTAWRYFVMPESVKEALRSDGTAFTVVGDSNIVAGALLTNGVPKYPIVISLAAEAIRDDEVARLTNYVAAGGFLLVGSSAFTRNTNGTTRTNFAFASELGVNMVAANLLNWADNTNFTKSTDHRLVADIPPGPLTWRMPSDAEEVSWGISPHPDHPYDIPHDVWQVQATGDAVVVAMGDTYPYVVIKPFGKGYFIYHAAFQPLIGHGGYAPSMYAYMIFRRAIEWAFESANLPIPKLSPWPYPYDAAFMVRHDIETFTNIIAAVEASAQVEHANGAKGDYYFCTGTVREDATNKNAIIAGLRSAVTNYGATIGPHNGGFRNPNNPLLVRGQYDYWHWGPDEALDVIPSGYPSGKVYAFRSISNAFKDVEGWLSGTGNGSGLRAWVSPYFNATREDSFDIQNLLNVKITGDQKLTPFPHWTVSTRTAGKRYGVLSEPVSDWFVRWESDPEALVAQSLEPWHPPGVHTSATMQEAIDFYYNLGALINIYSHTLTLTNGDGGDAGTLVYEYVTYGMNTNLHPRLWSANAVGVYQWWLQRSNAQVTASYATNGLQSIATLAIAGATHTNTAVEVLLPGTNLFCGFEVLTNGALADEGTYRVKGQAIKLRVGLTVTNAVVKYYPLASSAEFYSEDFDGTNAPALPYGWSTSATGAQSSWVAQASVRDTVPNAVYAPDASNVGVNELITPPILAPVGTGQLSFRNSYNLESGSGGVGYDGGVLEVKIGTNAFTDVVSAGGSFVAGGYNRTLSTQHSNPLAGRAAWSGNSGGFISTRLSLPQSASGQTIQLRWRCGTDDGGPSGSGWYIDSIALTNLTCPCCGITNTAPMLPPQPDRTIAELTSLNVTNAATDVDVPIQTLSYQLLSPPSGATISPSGVITWTTTEAQGPSTNTVTTWVVDNGSPALSATNTFTVVVSESNRPPVLPAQTNHTIAVLTTLWVTNTATDPDLPANPLTYSLLAGPTSASIGPSTGVITWTPNPAQDRSTNLFRTVVSDTNPAAVNAKSLSATNSFTVVVLSGPTLVLDSAALVAEGFVPTNHQADPGETVTWLFALKNEGGAATTNLVATLLATNGVTAPSGPESYGVVSVGGGAVSQPFSFKAAGGCGGTVIPTLHLQDGPTDLGTVAVTLTMGQVGMVFTQNFDSVMAPALPADWSTVASGYQSNWVTVTAVRDTVPNAAYANDAANIGLSELRSPLIALPLGPAQLSFRHRYAFESDTEQATNGYDGGVLEIAIGTNAFVDITNGGSWVANGYNRRIDSHYGNALSNRWAWSGTNGSSFSFVTTTVNLPAAAQGQTVRLRWRAGTDNGNEGGGWWVDSVAITGYVCVGNNPPALPGQANRTLNELSALSVTNTATDPQSPPQSLAYALVEAPGNALISSNGIITWTPSEAQGPGAYTFTTVVSDGALPPGTASNSFTVTVNEVNSAPTLTLPANLTINELELWTANASGSDTDAPPNSLTFELVSGPSGLTVSPAGLISWTPTEAHGPGTNTVVVRVLDDGTPSLSQTNSFTVRVNEVNSAPSLTLLASQTINELELWTANASGSDTDAPPNNLTFELMSGPGGLTVSPAGLISWTPTEAQGPDTNTVVVRVLDDGTPILSDTNSFVIVVLQTEPDPPPVIQAIAVTNGVVTITWSAIPGRNYRLQYKGTLEETNWTDVPPNLLATGSKASLSDAVGLAAQRFYRVALVP